MNELEKDLPNIGNRMKIASIQASYDIVDSINTDNTYLEDERKREVEEFYIKKILYLLPENVDAICLNSHKVFFKEVITEEKPKIWGKTELIEYLEKLYKGEE